MNRLMLAVDTREIFILTCLYANAKADAYISGKTLKSSSAEFQQDYDNYLRRTREMNVMFDLIGIKKRTAVEFMRILHRLGLELDANVVFREYRRRRLIAEEILRRLIQAQ